MGCEASITAKGGPVQCDTIGRRVRVVFHYDTSQEIGGTIVRDDGEAPFRMIIHLDDGRYLLTTECQWSYGEVETGNPASHGTSGSVPSAAPDIYFESK